MNLLHDYVKTNGKQFLYSELAIDLIQKYMNKFPLVFELINSSDANILLVSDLERNQNNQSPLEYLAEIRNWLQSLPHSNATRTPVDMMQFSDDALKHVYDAIRDTVSFISARNFHLKFVNLTIHFIGISRWPNSQAQNEVAKSLHSRFEQCICCSQPRCII